LKLDPNDERLLGVIARSTCQRSGSPVCVICEPLHGTCRKRAKAAIAAIVNYSTPVTHDEDGAR